MKKNILNVHCLKSDEYHRVLDKFDCKYAGSLTNKQYGLFNIRTIVDSADNYGSTDMSYWMANGNLNSYVMAICSVLNRTNGFICGISYTQELNRSSAGVTYGVRPVVCISNEQSLVGL